MLRWHTNSAARAEARIEAKIVEEGLAWIYTQRQLWAV